MKTSLLGLLIAATVTVGASATAHAENAMYACTGADGVVSLTNVPTGASCEKLFAYAAPAPVAQAESAPAQTAPPAGEAPATSPADAGRPPAAADAANSATSDDARTAALEARASAELRMAQRRDAAIQQTIASMAANQPVAGMNRAVNRRYLMTTRADYQRAFGVAPQ